MKKIIIIFTSIYLLVFTNTVVYGENIKSKKIKFFIAKTQFIKKKNEKAIYNFYNIITKNNLYNKYSKKSKLYITLILYKSNKLTQSINNINDYIRIYKKDKYLIYLYYLKSNINYNQNSSIFKIFSLNKFKRENIKIKDSYNNLNNIIIKNLKPKYITKIKEKIIFLENEIIKHELHITDYYIKKRAFIATINRVNNLLKTYNNDFLLYKKLYILIKSYNELFMTNISNDIINYYNKDL